MEKKLVHYDYQEIDIKKHFKWLYMDYYPCFGWEVLEVMASEKHSANLHISMRRKYDLRGKDRLCHYQAKFDGCMEEIRNLEIAHFFAATLSAVLVGLIGMVFVAGTVILLKDGMSTGGFLLIPAIIAFLLAYPCYLLVRKNKQKQIEPFVKERYEELFRIGQAAKEVLEQS